MPDPQYINELRYLLTDIERVFCIDLEGDPLEVKAILIGELMKINYVMKRMVTRHDGNRHRKQT
jgi:hypothetical protein